MDMVCIYCGSPTQVVNSRPQKNTNGIWRRRRCEDCKQVFTTKESPEFESGLRVQHHNGSLSPFSQQTLFVSIYESCRHRPTAISDASALTQTIISALLAEHHGDGLLDRTKIVEMAQQVLQRFDVAAGTIYAAYHR